MKQGPQTETTIGQRQALAPAMVQGFKLLECRFDEIPSLIDRISQENLFVNPASQCGWEQNSKIQAGSFFVGNSSSAAQRLFSPSDKLRWLENLSQELYKESLESHLLWQLGSKEIGEQTRDDCLRVIHSLDERGFLPNPELLRAQLNMGEKVFHEALGIVQGFDPPGVARKSIQDCLLSQMQNNDCPQKLYQLVACHFDDLMAQRFSRIKRSLGLDEQGLTDLLVSLRSFTVIPARGFANAHAEAKCVFDLVFTLDVGERINVEVLGERVTDGDVLDLSYLDLLRQQKLSSSQRGLLEKQRQQAISLVHALAFRHETLARLGLLIAREQHRFFIGGRGYLVPLTMQEAGREIGLSVSAISRAVKDKYAYTPQGSIALRDFFIHGGERLSEASEGASPAAIEDLIAQIVGEEDPRYPYSDLEISASLATQYNVSISRRTVAKYREKQGILPQSTRRALAALH